MTKSKKVLLCISGSIAAYKSAIITRLLVKKNYEVKIIMTADAVNFITPLTLSTLSKNPVLVNYTNGDKGEWNNHVELANWADLILIAPASANTIGKMANGICDNLLMATYFSGKCPVFVAPAMDLDMYIHPSITSNIKKLSEIGNYIIPAEEGELASGLFGKGRMAEPETIIEHISVFFEKDDSLKNKSILISAGPTYQAIDPVRFIGNHSSGKMGIALAEALVLKGANVHLVLGPSSLKPMAAVNVYHVTSAEDMYLKCNELAPKMDAMIMAAAVADYTPKTVSSTKIKKENDDEMVLTLQKTKDILKSLGEKKQAHQVLIGFALETNQEIENAQKKLNNKNCDFIVLNSMQDKGAGFKADTNKISIIRKNDIKHFELKDKKQVAIDIINELIIELNQKN